MGSQPQKYNKEVSKWTKIVYNIRDGIARTISFIPKYRKKIMYGTNKKDLQEIIPKLCEMKGVVVIEGKICRDHVHMYVSIPPKMAVSEFMSYLKGKSALMIYDRHPELRPKYADRHLWARGYYVSTIGNVNEETIREYIRNQEENDKLEDGIK